MKFAHDPLWSLEVTHWWTSEGEAKAVKALADAYNASGDKWRDTAIGGGGGIARPVIVSRIVGGAPMGTTQFNHGQQALELVEEKQARCLPSGT